MSMAHARTTPDLAATDPTTPTAITPAAAPPAAGWSSVAMAVHAVQGGHTPLVLKVLVDGTEVTIDFLRRAHDGGLPPERFPVKPTAVSIETQPTFPGAPPLFALPGAELDALLWHIGFHAFPDGSAPWLPAGSRFRLTRWPNLSDLPITLDQVRMTAMLGNGYVSAAELAEAAGVDAAEARNVVNAFAVVGILRAAVDPPPPPVASPTPGLFSRLRARFGTAK